MKLSIHEHQNLKIRRFVSKKLLNVLILLPVLAFAQLQVDNQWKNAINPVFQNLDKTKIQFRVMLNHTI